jgi:HEPN domain-containing protein
MGVSSSADDLTEASRTLARKAMGDATAAREFAGNSDITDEIIGFHAQQAIEKWLKAIIAGRGESFEHTHDLRRLVRVAAHDLGNAPFDVDAVIALTQYSAPLRYEDLLDAEPLDREATISLVDEVRKWAEDTIKDAEESNAEDANDDDV